ncbi:hypothetical protein, partial [Peribacillus simplex]|uniref:hypothetical protein n=1 Tax=Peribacillus simplex TaxID=1478 RepID=UPI001E569FF4
MNKFIQLKRDIRKVRKQPILRQFPNFRPIISKWEELLLAYEYQLEEMLEKWRRGEGDFEIFSSSGYVASFVTHWN